MNDLMRFVAINTLNFAAKIRAERVKEKFERRKC
jgi:hypothetical protein